MQKLLIKQIDASSTYSRQFAKYILFTIGFYPEPFIYVMSKNEIKSIDLLTVDTTDVVRGLKFCYSIVIDNVEGKLYFKNDSKILRSNLDGTNSEIVVKKADLFDMTIDWLRRRIFWTQRYNQNVLVANLNGNNERVLKRRQYRPAYIAVDPIMG